MQKGFLWWWSAPEIMSFVPNQFDQFVYFSVDDDLLDYLVENWSVAVSGEDFRSLAETIDTIVMYQYATGDIAYSVLFVKDNGGFTIEKAQQLWLIPEATGYSSASLGGNIIAYGDEASLGFLKDFQGLKVSQNQDLKTYFKNFWSHNVGFVSTPLQSWLGANPLVAQFANKLKYTQVMSKIGKKISGTLRLQFDGDVLPEIKETFSSSLLSTASSDSSLAFEFHNLLSLFSLQKSQFSSLAGMGLNQVSPEVGWLLTTADYESLYDIFNGQIMFAMKPSPSMIGMSAKLVFSTPWLLPLVDKLSPVLGGLISNVVGSGNVSVEKSSGSVNFKIVSPVLWGEGSGVLEPSLSSSLSVTTIDGKETLSLFDTPSSWTLGQSVQLSHPNTLAIFYSQGPQVNSMVGLPATQEGSWLVAIEGTLYMDGRQALEIEFIQK